VEFGRLDAAFNNAGVMAKLAPTAASTLEEFDRVTRVNLRGVWSCMKQSCARWTARAVVQSSTVPPLVASEAIGVFRPILRRSGACIPLSRSSERSRNSQGGVDLLTALLDPVLAPPTVIAHSPSTRFFMLSNCLGGDQISPD
jgi:NAD(P)-dependent dehydrogenase (short-subunit alcohol dehydrogenase family)